MVFDYRKCGFDPVDVALCEYALALTLTPGKMTPAHVQALQEIGFSDEQITLATQVISYFNYINRIADGLGVDPEEWMTLSVEEWKEKKPSWAPIHGADS